MRHLIVCAAAQISFLLSVVSLAGQNETKAANVMRETWDGHDENLELVYQDDDVAVYYNEDVNKNGNITWPFKIISQGWKYLRENYGPSDYFKHDPLLYFILHAFKYEGCFASLYYEDDPQSQNQIDCGQTNEIRSTSEGSEMLIELLFQMVIFAVGDRSAGHKIDPTIGWRPLLQLLWYDLNKFLQDPTKLLAATTEQYLEDSKNGIYWLRDWYLPIYQQFGETSVLVNFYNILHNNFTNLPSSPTNTSQKELNLGELIHFWSEAAGQDLYPLAKLSINNSRELDAEIIEARKTFSISNYKETMELKVWQETWNSHGELLTLAFQDDHVAIYYDKEVNKNGNITWPFEIMSRSWRYVKETYKTFGPDPLLYVILHGSDYKYDGCWSISYRKIIPNRPNIIDCGERGTTKSTLKDSKMLKYFLYILGAIPTVYGDDSFLQLNDKNANGRQAMLDLISFDLVSFLKDPLDNLVTWKKTIQVEKQDKIYWFRDWYLPLYEQFGGSSVLRNFFSLTNQNNWPDHRRYTFPKNFNLGEVVHFWSGAAQEDLLPTAIHSISNSSEFYDELVKARKLFPFINYTRENCTAIGKVVSCGSESCAKNIAWRCNGKMECSDGSDEANCTNCKSSAFKCAKGGCVDKAKLCDNISDCPLDHSDESNCEATQCKEGEFRCETDFVCIRENLRCNGIQDCSDNSDEANCVEKNLEPTTSHVVPIVVGVLVFGLVVASIGVGWKISLDRKQIRYLSQQIRNLTIQEVNDFLKGNVNLNEKDANGLIYSMPFIHDFEIDPEQLIFNEGRVLGSGEFGVVKEGKLLIDKRTGAGNTGQTVAVKMMKPNAKVEHFKAFLVEIKIMAFLGHHQNIASLLATVTSNIQNGEVFVALEFCSNGDLLRFLRSSSDHFQDLFCPKGKNENVTSVVFTKGKNIDFNSDVDFVTRNVPKTVANAILSSRNSPISTLDLLEWSREIADGMNYLTSKKVIHGDLAAQNILLTENKTAKISDFGLSHQLINYDVYRKTSKSPLPWRWLAIESLSSRSFSVHSDVWAFGVTLWEIFTLGQVPFPERRWDRRYINDLANGMRPNSPQFGNEEIYNLMMSCMRMVPSERIPFSEISLELHRIQTCLISKNNLPSTSHCGSSCIYSVLQ